jgi:hypothetical protein
MLYVASLLLLVDCKLFLTLAEFVTEKMDAKITKMSINLSSLYDIEVLNELHVYMAI